MSRGLTVVSRLRSVSFRSLIFRNGSQTRAGEEEPPAPDLRLFWKVPENRNSSPPRETLLQRGPSRAPWVAGAGPRARPLPAGLCALYPGCGSGCNPRPPRIPAGSEPRVASLAEPAQPSRYANRPCDGKCCLAQPCSSVHIWAATSRALRTCP